MPIGGNTGEGRKGTGVMPLRIILFANGNTGVFKDGEQVPELQESWLIKFVEFLEASGIEPDKCEIHMPTGGIARLFKTEDGYNWEIM